MRGFAAVKGQSNVISRLNKSLETGRIAHAYLFAGPAGVGKKLTAAIFARALNCDAENRPCDSCVSCQKAVHLNHPDIMYLKPDGSSFKIDQARELKKMVHARVYEGKYKVFILEDMHQATLQATNSLLKTLEEPPGNTVFILLSENPDSLPKTVLSRCQRLNFSPLTPALIQQFLVEKGYDPEQARLASELSLGSLGRGLKIIEDEQFLTNRHRAKEYLHTAFSKNYFNLYKIVELLDKEKVETKLLLEQMLTLLRDRCLESIYKARDPNYTTPGVALNVSLSNASLSRATDLVIWASDLATKKANNKLLLDVLGIRLGRLAEKGGIM